jgi:hypothetical protein
MGETNSPSVAHVVTIFLHYVLIHVVQTNIKYLYTVSFNILYMAKTKYLRYVPILVNK